MPVDMARCRTIAFSKTPRATGSGARAAKDVTRHDWKRRLAKHKGRELKERTRRAAWSARPRSCMSVGRRPAAAAPTLLPFSSHEAGWAADAHPLMVNTGVAGTLRSIEPWASTRSPATRSARVSTTACRRPGEDPGVRGDHERCPRQRTSQRPRVTTAAARRPCRRLVSDGLQRTATGEPLDLAGRDHGASDDTSGRVDGSLGVAAVDGAGDAQCSPSRMSPSAIPKGLPCARKAASWG